MKRMVRAAAVAALLQVIPTLAQPVLPPMPTNNVMTNHQEFVAGGARVQIMDTNRPTLDDHATHVADTLAAWGTNGGAKGFSHRGRILSSDFQESITIDK